MLTANLGKSWLDEVESTSLAKDICLVKPWKSLAVALTDLKSRSQVRLTEAECNYS